MNLKERALLAKDAFRPHSGLLQAISGFGRDDYGDGWPGDRQTPRR
jgi:hypothetical protein